MMNRILKNSAYVGLTTTTLSRSLTNTLMILAPEPYILRPILFPNPNFEKF